jgi:two-component system KDP operon response regulator KdpE
MNSARIMLVDDEPEILRTLRANLVARDYDVLTAESGGEVLDHFRDLRPDVLVVDLCLPDIDGLEVIRQVRKHSSLPIIVLSVRGAERDKVTALDWGADDYVTKPFGIDELLARIRAALRRADSPQATSIFECGELRVNFELRQVTMGGQEVHLTPTEYDLLRALIGCAGKVLTHRRLLHEVWGDRYGAAPHYLHVYMAQLRHKLEPDPAQPHYIMTEPGVGYRFRGP